MIENMDVKERVILFIKSSGMSVLQFERRCGLSNGYIKNFKGNFGSDKLENLLSAFPNLSREWLLTGEGEMLKESSQTISSIGENGENVVIPGKVWKVIEQQADSLAARDKQIDDLIAILKESQKRDADDAHQEGNATSAVVG